MSRLDQIAEEALKAIAFTHRDGETVLISVPVRYPSGSLATLEISAGHNEVFVSDRGMGYWEAETLCAESSFDKFARDEARRFGVRYEAHSIIAIKVPIAATAGAIVAVANASASAAAKAVAEDGEKKEVFKNRQIYDKVRLAFPDMHVHEAVILPGERATWKAHNVVELHRGRYAVFEPVSKHANSISSKFLMLSDLFKNSNLRLNAVFESLNDIDPKAQIIGEVAHLMGADEPVEIYQANVG